MKAKIIGALILFTFLSNSLFPQVPNNYSSSQSHSINKTITPIYDGTNLPNEVYPAHNYYYQLSTGLLPNKNYDYGRYEPDFYTSQDVVSKTILPSGSPHVATTKASGGIHITDAGTATAKVFNPGNNVYPAATRVSKVLKVNKAPQTITFNALPLIYVGAGDTKPGGTSSSGLPISYTSSSPAVASIVNGNIHIIQAGTTTITASQPGNSNYLAAEPVSQPLQVAVEPTAPNTSYPSPEAYTVGTAIAPLSPQSTGLAPDPNKFGQTTVVQNFSTGVKNNAGVIVYSIKNGNRTEGTIPATTYTTAIDLAGNVYVADGDNNVIEKINSAGVVSIFAGSGKAGFTNGTGTAATFNGPTGVAVDGKGNVYVADLLNNAIREISPAGVVSTLNLTAYAGYSSTLNYPGFNPSAIFTDNNNNLYVVASTTALYYVNFTDKIISSIPHVGYTKPLAIDPYGNIYKISGTGVYKNGNLLGDLYQYVEDAGITGLAADASGNVYALSNTEFGSYVIMITPAGRVIPIAGSENLGNAEPGPVPAFSTNLTSISTDGFGTLYVGDAGNNLIRKLVVSGYFISRALPEGLTFNSVTGVISGIPAKATTATAYTIGANNTSGGGNTTNITLSVSALATPVIGYKGPQTYVTGTAISPLPPTNTGGAIPVSLYGQTKSFFLNRTGDISSGGLDKAGNIYIIDNGSQAVKKITPSGVTTTLATSSQWGNNPNGGPQIAVDGPGNVYVYFEFAASGNHAAALQKITPAGLVTTINGNMNIGVSLYSSIVVDSKGNVYFNGSSKIYQVTPNGAISVFAGSDIYGTINGTGSAARFAGIQSLAIDGLDNIYLTEFNSGNYAAVRMITPAGVVTTVAGGVATTPGIDGVGKAATLSFPFQITADAVGNLFVIDFGGGGPDILRKIAPGGIVSTVGPTYFGGPLLADGFGNVYGVSGSTIFDTYLPGFTINTALPAGLTFDTKTGIISGTPKQVSAAANYKITATNTSATGTANLSITVTSLIPPPNISYSGAFVLFVGNAVTLTPANTGGAIPNGGYVVSPALPDGLKLDSNTGIISGYPTRVAVSTFYNITATNSGGSCTYSFTLAVNIKQIPVISYVTYILYDNFYTGTEQYTINKPLTLLPTISGGTVPPATYAQVSTFAGSGTAGNTNGTGTAASFKSPAGLASDASGNVYVADRDNNLIRKITPLGVVSTAGGTSVGQLSGPTGVAVDNSGNIYVADRGNNVIRKITSQGALSTFAGSYAKGSANGAGASASFYYPSGIAIDASGYLYVADQGNNLIRKISPSGTVSTLAGSGAAGSADGTGVAATFNGPTGIILDNSGNVYVTDAFGNKIREISPAGVVTTVAGSGATGSLDGVGKSASFNTPAGITIDLGGNLYVAEQVGQRVRKITPSGMVTTLAGSGAVGAANAVGPLASFNSPFGITADGLGNLYVADYANNLIRKVGITGYTISPALPTGLTFASSTGTISGTPTVVSPGTNYTVTAYNQYGSGSTLVYIAVNPPLTGPSANSTALTNLSISTLDNMNGADVNGVWTISTTVRPSVTSASFTPVTQDPNAKVTINGIAVADSTASALIPLMANAVTDIFLVVTAADGSSKRVYKIVVNRGPSSNTILTSLSASNGTQLTGASVNGLWTFTGSAGNSVNSLTFTPVTSDPNAKVTINGIAVADNAASAAIALNANATAKITLIVTAADGVTNQTYPIVINRGNASSNTALTNVTVSTMDALSGAEVNGLWTMSATVLQWESQLSFTPTTADANATVTINGIAVADGAASSQFTLNATGSTAFTLVVTAADGITQQVYPITINKSAVSGNTALTSLFANNNVTLSGAEVNGYWTMSATVGASVTSLSFTPTTANRDAKVTINGTAVADNTASAAIPINVSGTTNITLIVTASDGVTKQTYPIVITKSGTNLSLRITDVLPDIFKTDSTVVANNILSPNGDGVNDTWMVRNIDLYPNNSVTVYDRIGHVVFTKKGYANDWAGTYGGSILNQGTYYYLLDLGNGSTSLKGFITVVRDR